MSSSFDNTNWVYKTSESMEDIIIEYSRIMNASIEHGALIIEANDGIIIPEGHVANDSDSDIYVIDSVIKFPLFEYVCGDIYANDSTRLSEDLHYKSLFRKDIIYDIEQYTYDPELNEVELSCIASFEDNPFGEYHVFQFKCSGVVLYWDTSIPI